MNASGAQIRSDYRFESPTTRATAVNTIRSNEVSARTSDQLAKVICYATWVALSNACDMHALQVDFAQGCSFREPIKYVACNANDGGVVATQAMCPIGRACCHDRATSRVNAKNRGPNAVFWEAVVPITVARSPSGRAGS